MNRVSENGELLRYFKRGARYNRSDVPVGARLRLYLVNIIVKLQNLVLALFNWLLYEKNRSPRSILIVRTGSLGDSLCAVPAIRCIAAQYPEATIDILTNAGRKNLAGMAHLLDKNLYREVIDYFGMPKKELFGFLRKRNYDLVIQLPQADASFFSLLRNLVVFRAIATSGWGWRKNHLKLFAKTQAKYLLFNNEIKRLLELVQQYGVRMEEPRTFLQPGTADQLRAEEVLKGLNLSAEKGIIAVVPGAKRPQNRWPLSYFQQVIAHFASRYSVVIIGGPEDAEWTQPLVTSDSVKNACGLLTPLQSAALLQKCLLTISNDTGPMHLSYAVGTPTLALFSSRDLPGKWFPVKGNHAVLRATDIPCQACFSETCGNNICMQAILPSTVIGLAEKLIGQSN